MSKICVLLPYKITLLSNRVPRNRHKGIVLLPYKITLLSNSFLCNKIWLRVQDKKSTNKHFQTNRKALNSWLVGLLKCKECGLSIAIDIQRKKSGKVYKYLFDGGWQTVEGCVGRTYDVKLDDIEESVYTAMCARMEQIEIVHKQKEAPDMEVESVKGDILKPDTEIRSLMDRMAEADDVVFAYIQQRIKELHSRKSELERKLQTKARKRKAKVVDVVGTRWSLIKSLS